MASGIIEKSNSGLFCNEIEMNGKYATMVRFLKEEIGIFSTFREAYIAAAIIGFLYNIRGTADSSEKVQPASIFPNELSKRLPDLKMLYRIIMLADESKPYTIDEYMNRAFRDDAESETSGNLKNNMTIFNAYVCGGLEILYEKFKDIDKIDNVVNTLYDFVHEFIVDVGMIEDNEELPDFNIDDLA